MSVRALRQTLFVAVCVCSPKGGVSKATRQLHISEDIFGGMNHTLRGGQIKYREYISCGKVC